MLPNEAAKALIVAPRGRDAPVASKLLREIGLESTVCPGLASFQEALGDEICVAIVAEEAMRSADLRGIAAWVRGQPPWSDLPFIILTHRSDGAPYHPETPRLAEILGNVTFLERPFHPLTFFSVIRTARKGRERQYEARARIQELHESEENLEQRVSERTAELYRAHASVLEEIAQRERAEHMLRQAQKMEMIGQLTGGVAHDFNNLLMAVIGNLDLLRKRLHPDPGVTRLIDGALRGAQRGAALTQRLLAFARRQDLKLEPTNLAQLLRGMTDLIERSIGSQVELVLKIADALPHVLVDANQIELAILNLVVNARDAMPNGGTLTLQLDQPSAVDLQTLASGAYVRLSVIDTGIGMDRETLMKATEPFFSTKELGKGTGLGLSMIHGLARQLGGALRLSSELGRGSQAELWLPATDMTAAPGHKKEKQVPKASNVPPLTIMVVDDDTLISMSTAMMVEDLGYKAIEVNSGSHALELLHSGQHIDLLITDFSMPKMNGAQLARAVRQMHPKLPILLATGYAELPPGNDWSLPRIDKPYQQQRLAAALADMLVPPFEDPP